MPSIQETAYPRLKSNSTSKELDKLFSPTPEELIWSNEKTRNSFSQLGLLILLKTFQCLNYFVPITDVPHVNIKHIGQGSGLDLPDQKKWKFYHRSGTGIRQIAMFREYHKVKVFDNQARQVMFAAMENSVLEKDEKSDIINVQLTN